MLIMCFTRINTLVLKNNILRFSGMDLVKSFLYPMSSLTRKNVFTAGRGVIFFTQKWRTVQCSCADLY